MGQVLGGERRDPRGSGLFEFETVDLPARRVGHVDLSARASTVTPPEDGSHGKGDAFDQPSFRGEAREGTTFAR